MAVGVGCQLRCGVIIIQLPFGRVLVGTSVMAISTATTAMLIKPITSHRLLRLQTQNHTPIIGQTHQQHHRPRSLMVTNSLLHNSHSLQSHCQKLVDEFDPDIPIEKAATPPSSWYTDPSFFDFELHRVFYKGWQAVG